MNYTLVLKVIVVWMLTLSTITTYGQKSIAVKVLDGQSEPLIGATTVLLTKMDSTMVSFGITNDEGDCILEDVELGKYILQVSYVGHTNYSDSLDVTSDNSEIQRLVHLAESSEILNEVTIKAEHIPMGILGDTISYNAAAFRTRPGASVEDLLKKLPGVEVDRAGNIKAQGEDVENVLVDGKEFFGDDPLIATKNLEAEAIDKVQVYDKKSDIAEFTGIDDGDEKKTINLKLKDGYKTGGFGNVEGKAGTEDTWSSKLNYNRFSTKMQAALIASGNNINERSFSINEYISFMGGLGNIMSGGGSLSNLQNGPEAVEGIVDNYSAGFNFNYDFSKKLQLFSHSFYSREDTDQDKETVGENFNSERSFQSLGMSNSDTKNQNYRMETKLKYEHNPLTEFQWTTTLGRMKNMFNSSSMTSYLQQELQASENSSDQLSLMSSLSVDSELQLRKKYLKDGRNWITSMGYESGIRSDESDVLNRSFANGQTSTIDQLQQLDNDYQTLDLNTNFTEPLGRKYYLGLRYSYVHESEDPIKNFYDRSIGIGQTLNSDLSSNFGKEYVFNRAGLSLRKNTKNIKTQAGLVVQYSQLTGVDRRIDNEVRRSFVDYLPFVTINLDMPKNKSVNLNYFTQVSAPSLRQLMPVVDNSNPNMIYEGNVNLIPSYIHMLSLGYNTFDMFDMSSFFVNAQLRMAQDYIVNEVSILEDFTRSIRPVNTDRYFSASSTTSYSRPIRAIATNFRTNLNTSFSSYTTFLDGKESDVKETMSNISMAFSNRNDDILSVEAGLRMQLTDRRYALNKSFNQSFFNHDWFVDVDLFPSDSWTLSTSVDYRQYSDAFFSSSRSFLLLHASVRKSFAENRYSVSIKGHDLLNQNIGLSRTGGANSLQESNYNTLGRYIMVGFSYKIKQRPGGDGLML